ncbi:hypothetical protein AC32_4480 [Escherichia coli 3-105-05_S3_C2]|nr:hypothetical protein AC04_4443 [Escherichia coli 3-105-05_S3_C1]KDT45283.1 hypothetical protein AC32_4480 [Escherichia coli 3-105-05_S3_C2]
MALADKVPFIFTGVTHYVNLFICSEIDKNSIIKKQQL